LKIVYHCYGGAHASPTAAAIHLGILSKDKIPGFADFKRILSFDAATKTEQGKLIYAGNDQFGNEIYFLARGNCPELVINIIKEFSKLKGEDSSVYYFVDCMQRLNLLMIIGGFSSRSVGWVSFGRPIVTLGTMLAFPTLVAIVEKTIRFGEEKARGRELK
jgi:hypothetical protein